MGIPSDFSAQYAIDERFFWRFLETTQSTELDKLRRNGAKDWKRKVLERFDRLIKKHGLLHLLKKGLPVDDAFFVLMYPAPLASSSQSVQDNFAANIFSETRQLRYSEANKLQEIDMALFLNGIPLATIELKNAWTGQNARYHGQKQYREDRDTSQPLLQFARCLVHLAVDTDEVYMTTKLAGAGTFFLPFNKGHNHGKGNPPNPNGHKSAYLWQEVFTKDSLANIIQHFVRLDGAAKDPLAKRTLFFPRYHQLDVVRQLIGHASKNGVGQTYLIQHSAGSGKSNSITWAAYQLIETYPSSASIPGAKGIKFVNIAESIKAHPDFAEKYQDNADPHGRELAFEKMLKDIMLMRRKDELELYKLFANDSAFKASWQQSLERMINQPHKPSP